MAIDRDTSRNAARRSWPVFEWWRVGNRRPEACGVAQTGIHDAVCEELRQNFSEEEMVPITVAIGWITVWKRIAVRFSRPASGR